MTITVLIFLLITVRFVDSIGIGDYQCLNLSFYNQVKKWKTNVVYIVVPPTDMKRKLINSDYLQFN